MILLYDATGGFLLYVYWSGVLVPGCPHKVSITAKGDVSKVKVFGEGLKGGIAGYELKVFVDTREAGPGKASVSLLIILIIITISCNSNSLCSLREANDVIFVEIQGR